MITETGGGFRPVEVDDPERLARLIAGDPDAHPYSLADLDPPLWDTTRAWVAVDGSGADTAHALLLSGLPMPVFVAMGRPHDAAVMFLVEHLEPLLTGGCFLNLALGGEEIVTRRRRLHSLGLHVKYVWRDRTAIEGVPDDDVVDLDGGDLARVLDLQARVVDRGRFFTPDLLEQGSYVGVEGEEGGLVATAGTHVLNPHRRVAAVGNVLTHPERRGEGLGTRVTAAVLRRLAPLADLVGLNVARTNAGARRIYERLGFEPVIPYTESRLHPAGP